CAGMPMLTTEHGTPVITEGALQAYAKALKATILPADSPLQITPDVMVSCLQPKSSNKLVYIGFHHTFVHTGGTVTPPSAGKVNCGTNPVAIPIPTSTPFIRGPTDAPTGNQKLNSIFRTTLRPANNHSRSLLYGPGNIVQIHVFVPLQTYFSWHAHRANLIPDCDRFHRNENILRLKQVHGMINSERMSWGLGDEDLIITPPRMITTTSVKRPVIEELVISRAGMKDAKLLAQCIPNKERFLPYMEYRKAHRYDQREDMEWSEVAIRVLEQGVSFSTGEVKRIENTQTFKDLAPFLADFRVLEEKQWGGENGKSNNVCGVWEYWRALEAFRDRKYNNF
ncbi:hypothetical protein EV426DRAFT_581452, partial [Tirmania nivea]